MGEGTSKDKERSSETLNSFNNFIAHDKPSSLYLSEQGPWSQPLVVGGSEQLLDEDQIKGFRFKCSLPHEQRTSNTGINVRPYGVREYRTRRGKPCS